MLVTLDLAYLQDSGERFSTDTDA
ncbi:hypothetical protein NSND_62890 [Nitrospira sp. ND1]|nr:hypothetical protein NSND_62890 [Nitrospira sp. ND1]